MKESHLFGFLKSLDLLIVCGIMMVEMEFEAADVKHDGLIVGVGSLKFEDDLVEVEFEEIFELGLFVAIAVSVFAVVLVISSD